jgi:AraC-like DNA-binding protein
VEKLAEMVGMSPNYFATKFTKFYKISPIEMLIQTRMHHARELLKHTRLSITEIAKLCGFNSSQYFAKIFSKREHLSPKEFRNKMNNG